MKTLTPCLASGFGPGFGQSPGFGLPPLSFSRVWRDFFSPDFFSRRLPNPATAGYVTDRGYPVRGHAALRVVVKDRCALVLGEEGERPSRMTSLSLSRLNNRIGEEEPGEE